MKLTIKDKQFLDRLKQIYDQGELVIRLKIGPPGRLVLCNNYGDRIESHFKMSRQGVRWRFQRLFSHIYIDAYETIYWIESNFGTALRNDVIKIVNERVEIRKKGLKLRNAEICRR